MAATTTRISRSGMTFSKSLWSVTAFRNCSGKVSSANEAPSGTR